MKYNKKAIMIRAWEIRRAAAAEMGCKISEVHFGKCLEMAWAAVKAPVAVINEWAALTPEKQVSFLQANVVKAAKNEIRYSTEDHYNTYNETVAWFLRYHGLDHLTNEAYCKLIPQLDPAYLAAYNERRAAKGKEPVTLVTLVYRAAKNAIRQVYRDDEWHGRANVREIADKDGEFSSYVETRCGGTDDTEKQAMIRAALHDYLETCDDIDRVIINGRLEEYTEREIAGMLTISNVAVHHRLKKIRAKLQEILAA